MRLREALLTVLAQNDLKHVSEVILCAAEKFADRLNFMSARTLIKSRRYGREYYVTHLELSERCASGVLEVWIPVDVNANKIQVRFYWQQLKLLTEGFGDNGAPVLPVKDGETYYWQAGERRCEDLMSLVLWAELECWESKA